MISWSARGRARLQDPQVHSFHRSSASSVISPFSVPLKAPVSKYSRSQPDRSLKQFRPGACPCAVDRRLREISSGRRTVSRSPRRLSRLPCSPILVHRALHSPASTRADLPSRFPFDSPDILSAYSAAAAPANAICRIPPWDT